jgi:hypothetical protein
MDPGVALHAARVYAHLWMSGILLHFHWIYILSEKFGLHTLKRMNVIIAGTIKHFVHIRVSNQYNGLLPMKYSIPLAFADKASLTHSS